jgi:CheY-like chemotaxis protein
MKGIIGVVDDCERFRGALVNMLQVAGFEVWQVASGREALACLREPRPRPHLMLVDWEMPGMGGLELIRGHDPRAVPGQQRVAVVAKTELAALLPAIERLISERQSPRPPLRKPRRRRVAAGQSA